MSAHPPPVPPDNVSDKAPGAAAPAPNSAGAVHPSKAGNTAEQGQAGNSKINTTHPGHQQDR